MTLNQYQAQQKDKNPSIPQLDPRKVEQDQSLWKGAKELVKGADEDVYFVGKVSIKGGVLCCLHVLTRNQNKSAPKVRTKKEEKIYLPIEARFERPSRGSRGRGERGGGERGGGRTRERGQRSNGAHRGLDVGDKTAFPSLSGTGS